MEVVSKILLQILASGFPLGRRHGTYGKMDKGSDIIRIVLIIAISETGGVSKKGLPRSSQSYNLRFLKKFELHVIKNLKISSACYGLFHCPVCFIVIVSNYVSDQSSEQSEA